ncbi:PepSY domain-containing protein [Segetibacter sp. 3557_3]|uniref:PepSY-associated TM helix domain-containing protein n=1 Tax=Segetibacter sp. 3557_3 TaxID=2547429 RepID=UPI001058B14B|nr:PepSY-associated TM helix domain-containing protein [Segetibacter sp. 3557_3]TDH27319.1 PepSY domain-containing protein [Segetibacter sp. 3557_3]
MTPNRKLWRRLTRSVHLVLGLSSGLIIFIVSLSGAILVFQDEIKDAFYSYRKVEHITTERKPVAQLLDTALSVFPEGTPGRIVWFPKERPAIFTVNTNTGSYQVYVNPYSGRVLHNEKAGEGFFVNMERLHTRLLLPAIWGRKIVDLSIVVFVIMLITGLILWWPQNRAQKKQSFSIRWRSRWRRRNFDLHKVPGFYVFLVALVLAITGLSMSYPWLRNGLSKLANFGQVYEGEKEVFPRSDTMQLTSLPVATLIDTGFNQARRLDTVSEMFSAYLPFGRSGVLSISGYGKALSHYRRNDFYFDQYSGVLIKSQYHRNVSRGAKVSSAHYDLHTGRMFGLAGKLISFVACLACAGLPITGFFVWWGRSRKSKYKQGFAAARIAVHQRGSRG